MANLLLFFVILLRISSSSILASSSPFLNALDILSSSGYLSMALTLGVTAKRLNLESSATTIFAPWDIAFARSGHLSIRDLQYHLSPLRLSGDYFMSLPSGTRIPTLLSNHSLIVTTSPGYFNGSFSIDGVLIQETPLIDFGSVIVYGINEFFSSSIEISPSLAAPEQSPTSTATGLGNASSYHDQEEDDSSGFDHADHLYDQASDFLMSRGGYSVMGTFLGMQLFGIKNQTKLTIFAPADAAIEAYAKNFSDYSTIFRQHVVPGFFAWQELEGFDDGTDLPTFSGEFKINVTRSGDVLVLNGVPVIFQDMYQDEWLIIHGLDQVLVAALKEELVGQSFSELDGAEDKPKVPDFDEYGYGAP